MTRLSYYALSGCRIAQATALLRSIDGREPSPLHSARHRERAEEIIRAVQRGKRMVLTYRGRPVMRLEPLCPEAVKADDAFYGLADLAVSAGPPLTNEAIDALVYGS